MEENVAPVASSEEQSLNSGASPKVPFGSDSQRGNSASSTGLTLSNLARGIARPSLAAPYGTVRGKEGIAGKVYEQATYVIGTVTDVNLLVFRTASVRRRFV